MNPTSKEQEHPFSPGTKVTVILGHRGVGVDGIYLWTDEALQDIRDQLPGKPVDIDFDRNRVVGEVISAKYHKKDGVLTAVVKFK